VEPSDRVTKSSRRVRPLALSVVTLLAGIALAGGVSSSAWAVADADGEAVFDDGGCGGCHVFTPAGSTGTVGPSLDETSLSTAEIAVVVADGRGAMPPFAGQLSPAEIDAVAAYVGSTAEEPPPAPDTTEEPAPDTTEEPAPEPEPIAATGDPERGKSLFDGSERFEEKGPSCLSCHSVAGVGALGGGRLGPDLTDAYERFGGAQGLRATLEAMPFPTMAPVFSNHPLTDDEIDDLVAYLETAPEQQEAESSAGKFIGFSTAAAVVMVVGGVAIWRRRLPDVRKNLVNRSKGK
jgi:ubiquinol-cytochrome c reductase cytochrome c subunit